MFNPHCTHTFVSSNLPTMGLPKIPIEMKDPPGQQDNRSHQGHNVHRKLQQANKQCMKEQVGVAREGSAVQLEPTGIIEQGCEGGFQPAPDEVTLTNSVAYRVKLAGVASEERQGCVQEDQSANKKSARLPVGEDHDLVNSDYREAETTGIQNHGSQEEGFYTTEQTIQAHGSL